MNSKIWVAPMNRRGFLGIVGLGVGTLAFAGAGGLTWRAVDGGVFATGTGPAYAAWDQLGPSGQGSLGMVLTTARTSNADVRGDQTQATGDAPELQQQQERPRSEQVHLYAAVPVRGGWLVFQL